VRTICPAATGTAEEVWAFFQDCGKIDGEARLMHDNATGKVIRGFLTFADEGAMRKALQKNLQTFQTRQISVVPATSQGTMQVGDDFAPRVSRHSSCGLPSDDLLRLVRACKLWLVGDSASAESPILTS
jgi:hypothetical protein